MMLSIIIPCYNIKKYIKRCLENIIKEDDFSELEILIIDDGSEDELLIEIDSYLIKYKNIKYFYKKNGGLSDARNFGIEKSTSEYLMFLDPDDFLDMNFFAVLKNELIKNKNVEIVSFGHRLVDERGLTIKEFVLKDEKIDISTVIYNSFLTSACTKIIKRKLIIDNNIFFIKNIWYEDVNFILRISLHAKEIINCPKILYNYFQRKDSISKTYNLKILDIFKSVDGVIKDMNINMNKEKSYIYLEYCKKHHYSRYIRSNLSDKRLILKETLKYYKKKEILTIFDYLYLLEGYYFKGIIGRIFYLILSRLKVRLFYIKKKIT